MLDGSNLVLLIVVVDDMAFESKIQSLIDILNVPLYETFKVKLIGQVKALVGWEINNSATALYVNQLKYIQSVLQLHKITHTKPLSDPLPICCDITSTNENEVPLAFKEHRSYR